MTKRHPQDGKLHRRYRAEFIYRTMFVHYSIPDLNRMVRCYDYDDNWVVRVGEELLLNEVSGRAPWR